MNLSTVTATNNLRPSEVSNPVVENLAAETSAIASPLKESPELDTTSLHASISNQSSTKPNPEIASEDLIKLFETTILPRWQGKYKLSDTSVGALKFTVKNFLDDNNMLRIVCALGNEVAVAIDESMKQWGFPKWLANTLYYGLWAVAVVSCGARAVLRGFGTENLKPFLESSVQDAIAAIFGPTGVVMIANKAQDMIYKTAKFVPQSLINFARPIISVVLAEMAIPRVLDPIGKTVAKFVTGIVSKETYAKWSDAISTKLQSYTSKA